MQSSIIFMLATGLIFGVIFAGFAYLQEMGFGLFFLAYAVGGNLGMAVSATFVAFLAE